MSGGEFEVLETSDGSLTVFNPEYGETYHSRHGALEEARHVFLRESGIEDRLKAGKSVRVLEVGFGLGLNFFLTAATAARYGARLEFVSLEHHLLSAKLFHQVDYAALVAMGALGDPFRKWITEENTSKPGVHTLEFNSSLRLILMIGDAREASPEGQFDAVYMDAFSPDRNPELWTTEFLQSLADKLAPGGCLTTYSAKGDVRRSLIATGLRVEKRHGPPFKKEMLRAVKD